MRKLLETLSIGEVAEQTGVRTSALRYYESLGLLPHPRRVSGRRRYEKSVLQQVHFIQTAQQAGFSLDETKILLGESQSETPFSERMQELARRKLRDVDMLIARAQAMKKILERGIACECMRIEDCLLFIPAEDTNTEECWSNGR